MCPLVALCLFLSVAAVDPPAAGAPPDSIAVFECVPVHGETLSLSGRKSRLVGYRDLHLGIVTARPGRRFWVVISADSTAAPESMGGALRQELIDLRGDAPKRSALASGIRHACGTWFLLKPILPRRPVADGRGRIECRAGAFVDSAACPGGTAWITLYSETGARLRHARAGGTP